MTKMTGINVMSSERIREIEAGMLERKYPEVKKELNDSEILLEFSERQPSWLIGTSCALFGVVFAVQIFEYYLLSGVLWSIPALIICLALIWTGIWFMFLSSREYVFVTTERVVYRKANILGRPAKNIIIFPLSDISTALLYKPTVMYRGRRTSGDVMLKFKNGKSRLLPTLRFGEYIVETIAKEFPNIGKSN